MRRTPRQVIVRLRQRLAGVLGTGVPEDPTFLVRSDPEYRLLLDPSVLVQNASLEGRNRLGRNAALCGTAKDSIRLGYASAVGAGSTVSGEVTIGRYCSIGARVSIHSKYHPMNKASTYINSQFLGGLMSESEACRHISIGSDVWVGDGAIILRGVTIGDGSVIGANAVVTKDVPAYGVAVGNPARVIRMRFEPEVVRLLLLLRWWDRTLAELEEYRWLFEIDLAENSQASIAALGRAISLMRDETGQSRTAGEPLTRRPELSPGRRNGATGTREP